MINIHSELLQELPNIGCDAFCVLVCLANRINKDSSCYPSRHTLSQETGLSKRKVTECTNVLEEFGLIEKTQRRNKNNPNRNSTNIYKIKTSAIGVYISAKNQTVEVEKNFITIKKEYPKILEGNFEPAQIEPAQTEPAQNYPEKYCPDGKHCSNEKYCSSNEVCTHTQKLIEMQKQSNSIEHKPNKTNTPKPYPNPNTQIVTTTGQHSFEESIYFNLENFKLVLEEIGFANVDEQHYHSAIKTSAQVRGTTSANWKAYIELWLTTDKKNNKVVYRKHITNPNEAAQEEIIRTCRNLKNDINEGVFKTENEINSIIDQLREFWKKANQTLQPEIEVIARIAQNQLQTIQNKPNYEKKTPNLPKGKEWKNRLKSIKDPKLQQ